MGDLDRTTAEDLMRRLRGEYRMGPPGDPPELGYRKFETPPIQHEAAATIEAALSRIAELERERDEAERLAGAPNWTCVGCGSQGEFRTVEYETPGEPTDYDMECVECGSTEIEESAEAAFDRHVETLTALLRAVAASGVEADLPGVGYVTVQVDRETWKELRDA